MANIDEAIQSLTRKEVREIVERVANRLYEDEEMISDVMTLFYAAYSLQKRAREERVDAEYVYYEFRAVVMPYVRASSDAFDAHMCERMMRAAQG